MASQAYSSGRSRSSMVVTSSVTGDDDRISSVKRVSHYQVYRGMSPTTSNRLELKIKELEESLEAEREARLRAEKELSETSFHIEDLNERLEAAEGLGSAQTEAGRRREQEIQKLKKDLELLTSQYESSEASQKKRHQESLRELNEQIDRFKLDKTKHDKDRQQLIVEIDSLTSILDESNKAKAASDAKFDDLGTQLRRLQGHLDEISRQNNDLNGFKSRLIQENQELIRHVQELDSSNGLLSKTKTTLQQQVEEAKTNLDEESTARNQLAIQVNNFQVENENLLVRLEEEMDSSQDLRNQLQRLQNDHQQLKSKYDKEILIVTEEFEESRRKLVARLAELEDEANQARNRASKLEKEKITLQLEIREIVDENDKIKATASDLAKRLKHADQLNLELRNRVDELNLDFQNSAGERQALLAEVPRLKMAAEEATKKLEVALREGKQASDALREVRDQNKELTRKVSELHAIRVQLETERNDLAAELAELGDRLKDALAQVEARNATLNQVKVELENRIRVKDEEMDVIRKNGQRALEELQRSIAEIEAKYRSTISRLKAKYEGDIQGYDVQIENLTRANSELAKANKALAARIKELELALEAERRISEDAKQAVVLVERKRAQTQKELDDLQAHADASERARKSVENELRDAATRITELTSSVTTIAAERRRVEADISRLIADLDEANRARRDAEELADRLKAEVNRLTDELRLEQEQGRRNEEHRRQAEVEIKQFIAQLQESEIAARKDGQRIVAKLQARLQEIEPELDAEQRRSRDAAAEIKRLQRLLQEQRTQTEDANRIIKELTDQVNALQVKLKTVTRRLSEAEEVVAITMSRYRKANQMLDEYARQSEVQSGDVIIRSITSRSSAALAGATPTAAAAALAGATLGFGLTDAGSISRRSRSVSRGITSSTVEIRG